MSHAEERNTLLPVSVKLCKSSFDVQSDLGCDEHQQGKNKYTFLKSSQCLI